MKRPVSLVASLVLVLGTLGACSAAAAGKPQIAEACNAKIGSEQKCACFSDALEKGLTPEEFAKVAEAIEGNRRYNGLAPSSLSSDPKLGGMIGEASNACFN